MHERVGVLVAAGSAAWEVDALRQLAADRGSVVLLKRCVDLEDLLASAATGQARVAVLDGGLAGLDADSIDHLHRSGLAVILVGDVRAGTVALPGVTEVVHPSTVGVLPELVLAAATSPPSGEPPAAAERPGSDDHPSGEAPADAAVTPGRVVAVWGPTGAPGRTTVAVGLAAATARSGRETLLVDADAYGGAVAQHLGVLDELSGLLGAVRLANAGRLDLERLAATARAVEPRLRLLTGLPRADRWVEVREGAYLSVLDTATALADLVVLDLGFCLEQEASAFGSPAPQRNLLTVAGLDRADEIVVVGSADPVGLARLARGLVELLDLVPAAAVRVVVNRVRSSTGWREQEVRAMVEGYLAPAGVHFVPHDLDGADRALMAGRSPADLGDSALSRALAGLADGVGGAAGATAARRGRRLRSRTAGRAR